MEILRSLRSESLLLTFSLSLAIDVLGGSPPAIRITVDNDHPRLHYTGTLQASDRVEGPYRDVAGARSPLAIEVDALAQRFWRTRAADEADFDKFTQQVATGDSYTLAIRKDGTLWAWGKNQFGQLGIGSSKATNQPVQVGMNSNWRLVVASGASSFCIGADGTLWAWGRNANGQLGIGTTSSKNKPERVGTNSHWRGVAAGGKHTVALQNDGTLWAWGNNQFGQLGIGSTASKTVPVQVGTNTNWITIAAGGTHTLAIQEDGSLWVWGDTTGGALGIEDFFVNPVAFTNRPVRLPGPARWRVVAAGEYSSLALQDSGTLWAWGDNRFGQLGLGTYHSPSVPTQVGTESDWRTVVASGSNTVAAIRGEGTLWTWGNNPIGLFGDEGMNVLTKANLPVQLGTNTHCRFVASGSSHTVALLDDGLCMSWGSNASGELGVGHNRDASDRLEPRVLYASWVRYRAVAFGRGGLPLAIREDGTLNVFSEGIGADSDWQAVDAGDNHFFAIKANGSLWGWGANESGQLGISSQTDAKEPVQIGDRAWRMVSGGGFHTLAIRDDGTLWSWGANETGQLGVGTTDAALEPVQIGADNRWRFVDAGYRYSLAVRDDGTLWAWGRNRLGQLGIDNAATEALEPVQVAPDSRWIAVAAGFADTIAVKEDGSFWHWGNNFGNVLLKPVQIVTGSSDWRTVVQGGQLVYLSLAIRNDGTLWSNWGSEQIGVDARWLSAAVEPDGKYAVAIKEDGTPWGINIGDPLYKLHEVLGGSVWGAAP